MKPTGEGDGLEHEHESALWLLGELERRIGEGPAAELWGEWRARARRAAGDDFFFVQHLERLSRARQRPTLRDLDRIVGMLGRLRAEIASLAPVEGELHHERELYRHAARAYNVLMQALQAAGIVVTSEIPNGRRLTDSVWRGKFTSKDGGYTLLHPGQFHQPEDAAAAVLAELQLTRGE